MTGWVVTLVTFVIWVGVSIYLIQGCASVCATGWETSGTVGKSSYYGPEVSGSVGVSGQFGEERCQAE